jgi:hypothetical protein
MLLGTLTIESRKQTRPPANTCKTTGVSINRLMDERATVALTQFDTETRFRDWPQQDQGKKIWHFSTYSIALRLKRARYSPRGGFNRSKFFATSPDPSGIGVKGT